jgi:hypothetical protein
LPGSIVFVRLYIKSLAGQPSALPRAAGSTTAREFLPGGEMLEVLDPAASLLLELLHAAALAALAACAPEPTAGWACADLVSRLGAPLADLEALVAAVVEAGLRMLETSRAGRCHYYTTVRSAGPSAYMKINTFLVTHLDLLTSNIQFRTP